MAQAEVSNIPQVLFNRVVDEIQTTRVHTVQLQPNSHSQAQTRFILPKLGSVLDSDSTLRWRADWTAAATYNGGAAPNQYEVTLKPHVGKYNMIRNARFLVNGKLIFDSRSCGEFAHINSLSNDASYREEVSDFTDGANSGFLFDEPNQANGWVQQTQINQARNLTVAALSTINSGYSAGVGTGDDALEVSINLKKLFFALEGLQLPLSMLNGNVEVIIDWNTTWDDCMLRWYQTGGAGDIPVADRVFTIESPALILDYIVYNPEQHAALEEVVQRSGIVIPHRAYSLVERVLPADAVAGEKSSQIQLGMQGKSLMKVAVACKYANASTIAYNYNGNCRSDALVGEKYNFLVNDLLIFDADQDTDPEKAHNFSMYLENNLCSYPASWEKNTNYGVASAVTDRLSQTYTLTCKQPGPAVGFTQLSQPEILAATGGFKDAITGSQSYISVDLAKYGRNSTDNPLNGLRCGASPMLLNIKRTVDGTARSQSAVSVKAFTQYLRVLDVRGGQVDVYDM